MIAALSFRPMLHRWFVALAGLVLLCGAVAAVVFIPTPEPAVNPDPNHTHADFAVWINGKQLDFSAAKYMTTEAQEAKLKAGDLRLYLHLHDGNGHVIHRHKPGLTLRDFFETLGATFRVQNGHNLCVHFPQTREVCQDEAAHKDWVMVMNDNQTNFDPAYVFKDGDAILISFNGWGDVMPEDKWEAELHREWSLMTHDACLYSKTCPARGPAPTESCVSDPTVPCKEAQ